jgi:hypothetical protein
MIGADSLEQFEARHAGHIPVDEGNGERALLVEHL